MIPLRLLAACGLLLSGYLLIQKATGKISYLVGCGTGSGCENVLGSQWSQWFHVPVTALSLLLYAALFFLTFKPQRTALLAIATGLAGAAIWFGIVQGFILKSFCPWCLSAHLIGLACAALAFRSQWSRAATPAGTTGLLGGLAAIAVLIAGQVFGPAPDTHLETNVVLAKEPKPAAGDTAAAGPVHSRGEGRKITLLGNKEYNVSTLPHLGNADAPHVVVKYYDYACDSCRDLHEDLNAFMVKYPGQFCVVLLPCPINRGCNPHVPEHINDHPKACELARLALACWRSDPESFPAVHHALFGRPVMDAGKAMETVKPLMKKPLASDALADPWIAEVLAADAEDYKRVNVTNAGSMNYLMPKLLVGGTKMLHGVTKSRAILFQALESEFKVSSP
ncbi:vitamin K epoxide reductase family protein [Luteolibacter sp. Populi]|uniref:vitamin K epoxide reductase family protein n=1 Tax=Luteolibacter sp. Populi TaxID=3230487 RepID=UPI003467306E